VLARHATPGAAAAAALRSLLVTTSYTRRDVVAPILDRRPPQPDVVRRRLHAWGAYARRLPGALRDRGRDRRAVRPRSDRG
jgi:hypothetical protein